MAVQVWVGERPDNPNERKAIIALASGLDRLEGLYVMLANFSVGGRSIDLVILKRDAIFILELKHCDGRVFGSVNGAWRVVGKNGSSKHLNPGRKNPYNQVISYFYNFTNFLNDHKTEILSEQKASDVDFRSSKRVVVIVPTIEPGSEIELDWKVKAKGLDELPTYLVTEQSNGIELSDEELLRIPKLLHCQPWQEVNDLIAGVMPAWSQTPAAPATVAPAPSPQPASDLVQEETQRPVAPPSMWQQRRTQAQRWIGQVLAAFALVSIGILLGVTGWPTFQQTETPLPSPQLLPTIPSVGIGDNVSNGISTVNQPVAKHWDEEQQRWMVVAPDDPDADVVITLETVDFNNGTIAINWTVENRRRTSVRMALVPQNIQILDNARMSYTVDAEQSEPVGVLEVPRGEKLRATVIAPQAVRSNAITLQITLQRQPFEALWLVNVPQK